MRRNDNTTCLLRACSVVVGVLMVTSLAAQPTEMLWRGAWQHEPVAEGITLHRAAFDGSLFDANQYLCVLEVAPGARFDIVPAEEKKLDVHRTGICDT